MADPQVTAALVGASIAALASVLTLVLTRWGNRSSELRAAHRTLLYPAIERLGDLIHQVVAVSTIFLTRAEAGQDLAPWRRQGDIVARGLMEIRRAVRYPLWAPFTMGADFVFSANRESNALPSRSGCCSTSASTH